LAPFAPFLAVSGAGLKTEGLYFIQPQFREGLMLLKTDRGLKFKPPLFKFWRIY
jgi:hypothetical protein